MTFLELKKKLNSMDDDQLEQEMEVVISHDETFIVELAIGMKTDALMFVPEFGWDKGE